MKPKAVVLLSSGLDSSVNLYRAVKELDVVRVLTFNYGQRAALKEVEKSTELCKRLNLSHEVLDISWFKSFTQTSLLNESMDVPTDKVSINDMKSSEESAKAVWVPNRNGIFLNIAAAFAEGLGAKYIIPGFNAEEAATFPDNSEDFMHALDKSFSYSTSNGVNVKCYTTDMSKTEIVKLGRQLEVDFDLIWPCYMDGETLCGQCESCQRYERAVENA